jgi:hypothetical protein
MVSQILSFDLIVNLGALLNEDLTKFTETELVSIHAKTARKLKSGVIEQAPSPPTSTTIVDGHRNAIEESVKPFGIIVYEFRYWREVFEVALTMARNLSPVDTGRYKKSWFVLADGVLANEADPPGDAREYIIVNDQSYHRIVEIGKKTKRKIRLGHHIAEKVTKFINRRYGNFLEAEYRFIQLNAPGSGLAKEVPYIIRKRRVSEVGNVNAGQQITYPAIVMRPI